MSWLDTALESAGSDIEVDVSHLGLGTDVIMVQPLSAAEYQTLKKHPEIVAVKNADDRSELLGLHMIALMMAKCDKSVSWTKLKKLPLTTLGGLATAIMSVVGNAGGGGVLGE